MSWLENRLLAVLHTCVAQRAEMETLRNAPDVAVMAYKHVSSLLLRSLASQCTSMATVFTDVLDISRASVAACQAVTQAQHTADACTLAVDGVAFDVSRMADAAVAARRRGAQQRSLRNRRRSRRRVHHHTTHDGDDGGGGGGGGGGNGGGDGDGGCDHDSIASDTTYSSGTDSDADTRGCEADDEAPMGSEGGRDEEGDAALVRKCSAEVQRLADSVARAAQTQALVVETAMLGMHRVQGATQQAFVSVSALVALHHGTTSAVHASLGFSADEQQQQQQQQEEEEEGIGSEKANLACTVSCAAAAVKAFSQACGQQAHPTAPLVRAQAGPVSADDTTAANSKSVTASSGTNRTRPRQQLARSTPAAAHRAEARSTTATTATGAAAADSSAHGLLQHQHQQHQQQRRVLRTRACQTAEAVLSTRQHEARVRVLEAAARAADERTAAVDAKRCAAVDELRAMQHKCTHQRKELELKRQLIDDLRGRLADTRANHTAAVNGVEVSESGGVSVRTCVCVCVRVSVCVCVSVSVSAFPPTFLPVHPLVLNDLRLPLLLTLHLTVDGAKAGYGAG